MQKAVLSAPADQEVVNAKNMFSVAVALLPNYAKRTMLQLVTMGSGVSNLRRVMEKTGGVEGGMLKSDFDV